MASISVGEKEFDLLASAADRARLHGNEREAAALDKLARKANAALSNERYRTARCWAPGGKSLTWQDVPSTLNPPPRI